MSNGRIADAQIEALLEGCPPEEVPRMRYLLTGIGEVVTGLGVVSEGVADMRKVCKARGAMCPGMHGFVADPVDPAKLRVLAAEKARGVVQVAQGVADETMHTAEGVAAALAETTYRTRTMWGIGVGLLERLVLPVAVSVIAVALTLLLTGKL